MNKKRFVLAFLTVFAPLSTFAQNCPQGIPQGTPSCVSLDQIDYITDPPFKTIYWKKSWGAISSSPDSPVIGTSTGRFSRRSAVKEAIRKCKSKGGKACELSLAYQHQCAVVLRPTKRANPHALKEMESVTSVSQNADTIVKALEIAAPSCHKLNKGMICDVLYLDCTKPFLIG
ncbi:DUF4189 domain-containing protein [Acinetobacter bereziniae]|uniref:DUF4189 domain-containing protein n=1 Tax=Acinetobacter bereziniae TaxID=106648 RepID=A0A8I1AAR3_ACIBZ|nr:DUF4189 domain-containing protein [Acinetobacter bereziniae]MEC8122733.1 DUF4189 domain-containing protein [Pseudomonadota bacterium]MBI0395819.1 DUF4189 domain-containing protein [Acinetobacter bereziniae]MBJ9901315.1 DUF4189 domain-containing protein [Acinetobacter bereziniae]MBJ9948387.1 DUF4189 domain-containing protein [Acinetobacter bereziniae]MCU4320310.1 DUF4189 domain-containing protein [Acinetobacter bereziniae]